MDLNHIQLNTTDVSAAAKFYERYFGFSKQTKHGDGLFLWNQQEFMMAINPLPENPVFPDWFHIGFRFDSVAEVKSMYSRMKEEKSPIKVELNEHDDFVFFRCIDPTGYIVEVFWEPLSND
jgi:catechol 2,3-dioxygenase-like lactoylglutathione lyase family enzyme